MLAEEILNAVDNIQSLLDENWAEAKTKYEAAQKEYEAAVAARSACTGGNYEELHIAAIRAEAVMDYLEKWYKYHTGQKSAVKLVKESLSRVIERYEFFCEEETA